MRTDEEILTRVKEVEARDWMGFEKADLLVCLPYDAVKPYLVAGVTDSEWVVSPRDRDSLIAEMLDYMPFAWEKANGERGISAGRSMSHYAAWTWLAGDDLGDLTDYEHYGKDNLRRICEHYGWDADQWDDGERTND